MIRLEKWLNGIKMNELKRPIFMENSSPYFSTDVHFRATADFLPQVRLAARTRGITAASFMRNAIIDAMQRQVKQTATPAEKDAWGVG